jgi:hypothetical protein
METGMHRIQEPQRWEKIAISAFGVVFLLIVLIITVYFPKPADFQVFVFRVVLSLAAGAIAAIVPGFFHIESRLRRNVVKASGAIGISVLVYLTNPPRLATRQTDLQQAPQQQIGSVQQKSGDHGANVAGVQSGVVRIDKAPSTEEKLDAGQKDALKSFLKSYPSVAEGLRLRPELIRDENYIAKHPEIRKFLDANPLTAQRLREDPQIIRGGQKSQTY